MRKLGNDIDLTAAFDASANPYMLLTPDLRYAAMNQAYLDVTQRARDDLIGQSIFQAFDAGPGEDAPASVRMLRDSLNKVLSTGQSDHIALIHYAIPVTTEDGVTEFRDRYWSATHTPIRGEDGAITHILQHTSDVTELEELRKQAVSTEGTATVTALDAIIGGDLLRRAQLVQADNRRLETERSRLVEMFMQAPGFVAVLSGDKHHFQLFNEAYRRLTAYRDLAGKTVEEALPEVRDQGFIDMLDSVFQTGEPVQGRNALVQIARVPGGTLDEIYIDFIYQPIRDETGRVVGIFVQGNDVTENVIAAERQKLMIDELNHRVKNTLATVQSIAMQTARSHTDPRTFAQSFQSRLLALSHTHDLLTRRHWEGADLREILHHETQAHDAHRVILNGPPLPLEPPAALSLGMIFHELATNAAKYGALASESGRVFIDWSVANQTDRTLSIVWREEGGLPVREPERRGFGTRLIERNVRHDLAGTAKLSYVSTGFKAEISIPLDRGGQSLNQPLDGRRILVVEDESLVAMLIETILEDMGCAVVGPASSVDEALKMVADHADIEGALLDVNVAGREVFPVADALKARGVPFVFSTGYGEGGLPDHWRGQATIQKPFTEQTIRDALMKALGVANV